MEMTESCRLITTEQYKEYLKLKEEHKPISWEELKEEAKKMGATIYISPYGDGFERIDYKNITLNNDGDVVAADTVWGIDVIATLAKHRTPDQMLAIMKALQ